MVAYKQNFIRSRKKTKSVLNFLGTLEDDDDVQYVYANLEDR